MEVSRKPSPDGSLTGLSTEKVDKASAEFTNSEEKVSNTGPEAYNMEVMLHNIPHRVYNSGGGTNNPEAVLFNNGGVFNTFSAKFNASKPKVCNIGAEVYTPERGLYDMELGLYTFFGIYGSLSRNACQVIGNVKALFNPNATPGVPGTKGRGAESHADEL